MTRTAALDRPWLNEAIARLEADVARSADTHLIRVELPATPGITLYLKDESTHPSGSLKHRIEVALPPLFEPVGSTDTELIFCRFMTFLAEGNFRSLGEVDPEVLRRWLEEINDHGSMTMVLTDGHDLAIYADKNDVGGVYTWTVLPPYERLVLGDTDVEIDLTRRGTKSRKGVIVSSDPLDSFAGAPATWTQVRPGSLLMVRQGAIRAELRANIESLPPPGSKPGSGPPPVIVAPSREIQRPTLAEVRRLDVRHRTMYRYSKPVEKSTHLLRLMPVHDRLQSLLGQPGDAASLPGRLDSIAASAIGISIALATMPSRAETRAMAPSSVRRRRR